MARKTRKPRVMITDIRWPGVAREQERKPIHGLPEFPKVPRIIQTPAVPAVNVRQPFKQWEPIRRNE